MQIIREKIRFNSLISGGTMNLRFSLSSNDDFLGYQQEIDNLTQFVSLDLVNPVNDLEKRRFKSQNSMLLAPKLSFQFYSTIIISGVDNSQYYTPPSFVIGSNMFTEAEIASSSPNWLNSFFILDFYDTYDTYTQTKIFTTYLTKKGIGTVTATTINIFGIPYTYNTYSTPTPTYTVDDSNQLYYWYVPVSFINTQLNLGNTIFTGYVKFSFYNAKTGKIVLFYNKDNESGAISKTPEKMFFKTELNLVNKTWKFITTTPPYVNAKEMINNTAYITKVNSTVESINNLAQNPPSGDTFTYLTGTGSYVTT
jgi:hypothetical protein